MSSFISIAIAALAVLSANAHSASEFAVSVVAEQFKGSLLVPSVLSTFQPVGLASLEYPDVTNKTTVGAVLTKDQASKQPIPYIRGTAAEEALQGGPFNDTMSRYTILIIDAGVAGSNSTEYNLHWLVNDWVYGLNEDHTVQLHEPEGVVQPVPVVKYAGPNPPEGSGAHRYVTLIYAQGAEFNIPESPAPGGGVAKFNLAEYRQRAGLGGAIAGTYFTVEVGTASVEAVATTAVNSETIPGYVAPTSEGGAHGSDHSDSVAPSNTGSSVTPSGTPESGNAPASRAERVLPAGILVVAVVAGAFLWL